MQSDAPIILIADDDRAIVRFLAKQLGVWGYRTVGAINKEEVSRQLADARPDLMLLDLQFGEHDGIKVLGEVLASAPGLPVIMLTGYGSIDAAVEAIRYGAYDFLTKPPHLPRLRLTIEHALERQALSRRVERLKVLAEPQHPTGRLWGNSPAVNRLRDLIESIAPTDATTLILGESGTGKELVAHAVHDRSRRSQGPFVPVNMAALPRELVESTLFGHEKGAFTGAAQVRVGCCEAADGGTLFLDEIGEMELDIQAKLLRFLQEREVQRVGSSRTKTVDVRIVAATNRDLRERVAAGKFREDLFYRLHVVPIEVPPLRERRDDVPLLAVRFLEGAAARHGRDVTGFSADALALLSLHDWPGNVRQLENIVERLVILCRGREIGVADLPAEVHGKATRPATITQTPAPNGGSVTPFNEMEKRAILDALAKSDGNVRNAAKLLGLGQATVYRKIKRYAVDTAASV